MDQSQIAVASSLMRDAIKEFNRVLIEQAMPVMQAAARGLRLWANQTLIPDAKEKLRRQPPAARRRMREWYKRHFGIEV